jgi:hypothetical protein
MPVDVERSCIFEAAMPLLELASSSSSIGKDNNECVPPMRKDEEEGESKSVYMGRKKWG